MRHHHHHQFHHFRAINPARQDLRGYLGGLFWLLGNPNPIPQSPFCGINQRKRWESSARFLFRLPPCPLSLKHKQIPSSPLAFSLATSKLSKI